MSNWFWLPMLSVDSAPNSGVDPTLFWQIISGLGGAVVILASTLYKSERDRRIAAESKLEKFNEIAPELTDGIRWLVEEAQAERDQHLPWPIQREQPRRTARPTARRR